MPRKKYVATRQFPYHVWARSANREWFALPMDETWSIFSNYLYLTKHAFDFDILSFVLMTNHYHLNVRTPRSNLAEAMNYFQGEVSREIARRTGRVNQIFGAPYGRSILSSNTYYLNAYKYTYRNPVDAGICKRVEEYPYSTLHGLLGQSHLIIPVVEDLTLFSGVERTLEWLNREFPTKDARKAIGNALRKREFKLNKKFVNTGLF